MLPGKFLKFALLTLNLEALLIKKYKVVKLIVGGYPPPTEPHPVHEAGGVVGANS